MKEKKQRSHSRLKSRSTPLLYVFCFLISIFIAFFYIYTEQKSIHADSESPLVQAQATSQIIKESPEQPVVSQPEDDTRVFPKQKEAGQQPLREALTSDFHETEITEGNLPITGQSSLEKDKTNENTTGEPSERTAVSEENSEGSVPQRLISVLNGFYKHLDQQPYMKDFHLGESSRIHFSKLLQKLFNNPPVVTNETDDLFTILKNTAHFFRVLGKKNILVLKGILDREKDSFEEIIRTFYQLTAFPEALEKEYGIVFEDKDLYDYAAFFQSTMGGRLYLFRRDSTSRMTISFYAVMIIEQANSEGYNRHGIDLRPAVDSLIEEMENTGKNLRFKEDYLDKLYDLKEKYS
jgi:hypothetical protein